MQVLVEQKTIIGSREEQQDAHFVYSPGDMTFAAVCDGMGGTSGGSAASAVVVSKLRELVEAKDLFEPFPSFFLRAIDIMDESVVGLKKQTGTEDSGTTIVAAAIERGLLYWLAVGDSRLYIIRGNEIVQATRDHNFALSLEQLAAEGVDTASAIPGNHRADALISFIGIGGVKIYDINEAAFALLPDDKILLTTDGLTKSLDDGEILSLLSDAPLSRGLDVLFQKAAEKSSGAQDNTTCVLIHVENGGSRNG